MARTKLSRMPLLSAPDATWAEAVRREAVLQPLSGVSRLGRAAVDTAARALNLSAPRIYDLLRIFQANPVRASLLPRKPGQAKGAGRLSTAIEGQIEAAISNVFSPRSD